MEFSGHYTPSPDVSLCCAIIKCVSKNYKRVTEIPAYHLEIELSEVFVSRGRWGTLPRRWTLWMGSLVKVSPQRYCYILGMVGFEGATSEQFVLDVQSGSGMFRCEKQRLLSVSHCHLFLSIVSVIQNLRGPTWSMRITTGNLLPTMSISNAVCEYKSCMLFTVDTLFFVRVGPIG